MLTFLASEMEMGWSTCLRLQLAEVGTPIPPREAYMREEWVSFFFSPLLLPWFHSAVSPVFLHSPNQSLTKVKYKNVVWAAMAISTSVELRGGTLTVALEWGYQTSSVPWRAE